MTSYEKIMTLIEETRDEPPMKWGFSPEVQAKYLAELLLVALEVRYPGSKRAAALEEVIRQYEEGESD